MSDLLLPVATGVLGCIAVFTGYIIATRSPKPTHDPIWLNPPMMMATKDGDPTDIFCRDCGSSMVSLQRQDGFNPKTGDRVLIYERYCPQWTSISKFSGPWCGRRLTTQPASFQHNHLDPTKTETTCPVCIDLMVNNRVISAQTARELYAAAGAKVKAGDSTSQSLAALFGSVAATPHFGSWGQPGPGGTPPLIPSSTVPPLPTVPALAGRRRRARIGS